MQFVAISTESASSEEMVPSLREVERKSIIASASRCLVVWAVAYMSSVFGETKHQEIRTMVGEN